MKKFLLVFLMIGSKAMADKVVYLNYSHVAMLGHATRFSNGMVEIENPQISIDYGPALSLASREDLNGTDPGYDFTRRPNSICQAFNFRGAATEYSATLSRLNPIGVQEILSPSSVALFSNYSGFIVLDQNPEYSRWVYSKITCIE